MKQKLTTTLALLRKNGACIDGYNKLVLALQNKPFTDADSCSETYIRFAHKDEINLLFILQSNGVDDCLWSLKATNEDCQRTARLMAVRFAREIQHLMTDQRSIDALDVAERFSNGEATQDELAAAGAAALDASAAALAARAAALAARAAAWDAALDARAAAMDAALDARAAAMDATRAAGAAGDAAKQKQIDIIKEFLEA